MTYEIIGDSCLDLIDELKKDPRFQVISPILQVGSALVVDGETFDQKRFVDLVKVRPECPKTVYPSPGTFKEIYKEADAEGVFVITFLGHFSGSYNSAELVKKLLEEEQAEKDHGDQEKGVVVIDLLSVFLGELNVAMYTQALCKANLESDQMPEEALAYRDSMKTYLVLENLDTLRKNERLSGLQVFFAAVLNIKSVAGADSEIIIKLDRARGIDKAIQRMCDITMKGAGNTVDKVAVVCHVNHPQRTEYMKSELEKRGTLKGIVITTAAEVATAYANDGGIILTI